MNKNWILVIILAIYTLPLWGKKTKELPDSIQLMQFEVGSIKFRMRLVEGGVFQMGATAEQRSEKGSTDYPIHMVTLDSYYIGEIEVTNGLWQTVMPEWEIIDVWKNPNHPMSDVSWYDCQEFIRRLDSITGVKFRMPTEAEWEFAARGGNKSRVYRFSGSDDDELVSWGLSNSNFRKHQVAEKQANELGLYDMTGNISEWCSDWYAPYEIGTPPNPQGATNGIWKIHRGGSFDNCKENRHISKRWYNDPHESTNYLGLRLALDAKDYLPKKESKKKEIDMVKWIKIKNSRLKLLYVEDTIPYYIADHEVTIGEWKRIMQTKDKGKWTETKTNEDDIAWNKFLERYRKQSGLGVEFATREEIDYAISKGIIEKPREREKKNWERDTHAIQQRRKNAKRINVLATLVGVNRKMEVPDDPILELYNDTPAKNEGRRLKLRIEK